MSLCIADFHPNKEDSRITDIEVLIEIPDNATNGEVVQAIYGVMVLAIKDGKVWVEKMYFPFDEVWWNALYKAESEDSE